MKNYSEHIIPVTYDARSALRLLDKLSDNVSRTLFIVDENEKIVGSITDGDIRRGLLADLEISNLISDFMNTSFKFIFEGEDNVEKIKVLRHADINLIPMLTKDGKIGQIIDLRKTRTHLPFTVLLMAGGRGERLRPFTDNVPKPMLVIGSKPILEHNIDRLIAFGVSDIYISVRYLKEQIMNYFGDGSAKGIRITYIEETDPLGTLGALSLIERIAHGDILVMNADLLTNIDFEDFYRFYKGAAASMAVTSIPYEVNIPYAVLGIRDNEVISFAEKPVYTYYSNGGIYLMKFELQKFSKKHQVFNATDLMDILINDNHHKLVHYPLLSYWLDIGKHSDFIRAQEDVKHLNLL
jgi:dTDP-glucose pyrophosphorylase